MDEHMSIYNEVGGIRTLVLRNTTDEWDGLWEFLMAWEKLVFQENLIGTEVFILIYVSNLTLQQDNTVSHVALVSCYSLTRKRLNVSVTNRTRLSRDQTV